MKYLSFITLLILIVTLFSFVFTQVHNKEETKEKDYGIAFPLREAESRLPNADDFMQPQAAGQTSNVDKFSLAEPLEVAAKDAPAPEVVKEAEMKPAPSTTARPAPEVNVGKGNDDQDVPPTPPASFSTFVDPAEEGNQEDKTKNDTKTGPKIIVANRGTIDALFGIDQNKFLSDSLQKLQSRWESRIRQLTEPLQNGYSIILKASNSLSFPEVNESDAAGTSPSSSSSSSFNPTDAEDKVATDLLDLPQTTGNTPKMFSKFGYNLQRGGGGAMSPSKSEDDESNQTIRMATLALISKLFNVLHSHGVGASGNEESEDPESEESSPETIPVPVFMPVHHPNRMDSYDEEPPTAPEQQPRGTIRTTVMYGRPSAAASRYGQPEAVPYSSLQSLLGIFGTALQQQQQQPQPQAYPQRAYEPERETSMPRMIAFVQPSSPYEYMREEASQYQAPQPQYVHQAMSPASAPGYYIYQPMAAQSSSPRQAIVEVPVPVYIPTPVPVRSVVRQQYARPSVAPSPLYQLLFGHRGEQPSPSASPLTSARRMITTNTVAFPYASPDSDTSGNVAVSVVYPTVEPEASAQQSMVSHAEPMAGLVQQQPPAESSQDMSESSEPSPGMVRIFLRPKITVTASRMDYHRRIENDDSNEDDGQEQMESMNRFKDWRAYRQQQQQQQQQQQPQAQAQVSDAEPAHQQYVHNVISAIARNLVFDNSPDMEQPQQPSGGEQSMAEQPAQHRSVTHLSQSASSLFPMSYQGGSSGQLQSSDDSSPSSSSPSLVEGGEEPTRMATIRFVLSGPQLSHSLHVEEPEPASAESGQMTGHSLFEMISDKANTNQEIGADAQE